MDIGGVLLSALDVAHPRHPEVQVTAVQHTRQEG